VHVSLFFTEIEVAGGNLVSIVELRMIGFAGLSDGLRRSFVLRIMRSIRLR
jgi:hypothetical protein